MISIGDSVACIDRKLGSGILVFIISASGVDVHDCKIDSYI